MDGLQAHPLIHAGESQRLVASALDGETDAHKSDIAVVAPKQSKKKPPEPVVQLCVKRKRVKDKKKKKKKKKRKKKKKDEPIESKPVRDVGFRVLLTSVDCSAH